MVQIPKDHYASLVARVAEEATQETMPGFESGELSREEARAAIMRRVDEAVSIAMNGIGGVLRNDPNASRITQ